jgi:hypothetical protein
MSSMFLFYSLWVFLILAIVLDVFFTSFIQSTPMIIIDYRSEDGRFPLSASCVIIVNTKLLSCSGKR